MPIQIFSRVKDGALSQVSGTPNAAHIRYTYKKKQFKYKINKVWNSGESNTEIYSDLKERGIVYPRIYWVAFGYTGSGKTYTIYGMMRELLYDLVKQEKEVRVTAYQIYRNDIYDMQSNNTKLKYYKTNTLVIRELKETKLENIEGFIDLVQRNRKLASTNMNDVSSRSHAIIDIRSGGKHFTLVDMAGQESGVTGNDNAKMVQRQGRAINLDMLGVKECIRTFKAKDNHVPFRRCLLTLLLKPMFIQKCYVAFICTISATQDVYFQMDSLHYASSLYDDTESEDDKKYFELFHAYSDYINEVGWIACKERSLWARMRGGNFSTCNTMRKMLNKKLGHIRRFNKTLKKYEKTLPALNTPLPKVS